MKHFKNALCSCEAMLSTVIFMSKGKLQERRGDSTLIANLILIIMVIILAVVVFWPWLSDFFKSSMDNVDKKVNEIWNFS